MDEYSLISLFVTPLNELRIKYMITGSVASGMYSSPRYTNDVDLVLAIEDIEVAQLHEAFDNSAYYVPPIEVIGVEKGRSNNGHFNIIHIDSGFKADIFFPGNNKLIRWGLKNRRSIQIESEQTIWMAPVEYVVLLKLVYMRDGGSLKHIDDINAVLKAQHESIDYEVLHREIANLGLTEIWQKLDHKK